MTRHFLGWFLWTLLMSAARAGLAATIIVTTNSDEVSLDGACSLREAIEAANTNLSVSECVAGDPGLDAIGFAIPGAGVQTLSPQSALPAFSEPVMLDGYTQPGASANTLAVGNDSVLLIELDGAGAGAASGLTFLAGASGSAVRGLVINGFGSPQAQAVSGIFLDGPDNVTIQGNFIGTDPDGLLAAENWWGITLESSDANLIGGALPAERNVVSGNFNTGIRIRTSSTDNLVLGNYIGVDRTGAAPLGNRTQGLRTDGSFGTVIGGLDSGEANVISNNGRSGIRLSSSTALVQGNYIGTDASGSVALGNGEEGVGVFGSGGSHITRNTIFGNAGLGIDLDADGSGVADGVTPNDLGDGDSGGNGLQNFPVLSSALASDGMTSVEGSLNSLQDSMFTVELFANPICDVSAHGEGQVFLGAFELATDVDGNADFSVDMPIVAVGSAITATATNDSDQTSEFSSCVTAVPEPSSVLLEAVALVVILALRRQPGTGEYASFEV